MSRLNKNKNVEIVGYKVKDKKILKSISAVHKAALNLELKKQIKKILDTKTINMDNASYLTFTLKQMIDNDSALYGEIYQEANSAIHTLYLYLSEYFNVEEWGDAGYMCFDKKAGVATIYINKDNREVA